MGYVVVVSIFLSVQDPRPLAVESLEVILICRRTKDQFNIPMDGRRSGKQGSETLRLLGLGSSSIFRFCSELCSKACRMGALLKFIGAAKEQTKFVVVYCQHYIDRHTDISSRLSRREVQAWTGGF